MKDKRLELLSDEVRKGNPIKFKEAMEVVEYQSELKKIREKQSEKRLRIIKGFAAITCSMLGTLAVVFGEMDDSPGLGGIGLILIAVSMAFNTKLLNEK